MKFPLRVAIRAGRLQQQGLRPWELPEAREAQQVLRVEPPVFLLCRDKFLPQAP